MTIGVEISVFGVDGKTNLPDIGPQDPPGTFTDGNSLLIVSCNRDDSGGLVSRRVSDDGILLAAGKLRVTDGFGDVEAVIPNGGSYTVSIASKVGLATLTFTHKPPKA